LLSNKCYGICNVGVPARTFVSHIGDSIVEASILLVENDYLIRDFIESALTEAGFNVVVANNGMLAVAELDASSDRFGAMITDIKLGAGLDGWAVGLYARRIVPDISIVYVSGGSPDLWFSRGVPNSVLVRKPFTMPQVVKAISALLNEANACRLTAGGHHHGFDVCGDCHED
jgi:DNA-binding response OmpR family regulator